MAAILAGPSGLASSLVLLQSGAQPFEAFHAQHGATVEKWVRNACRSVGLIDAIEQEDVQQDVWERLLGPTRHYDGERSVTSYIYWLAKTAANGAKRLRRQEAMETTDADLDRPGVTRDTQHGPMLAWGNGFGVSALPGESAWNAAMDIDTVMASEAESVRHVVELTYWHGLTVREVAAVTGGHYSTVSRTLCGLHERARVRLAA